MKYRNKFKRLVTRLKNWKESSSRVAYLNKQYEYDRIATSAEIFKMDANKFRDDYFKSGGKSLDTGVFFDERNDPYIIFNRIRYNLTEKVVCKSIWGKGFGGERTLSMHVFGLPAVRVVEAIQEGDFKLHPVDRGLLGRRGVSNTLAKNWQKHL